MLVMRGVVNPDHHAALDARKEQIETELRSRFGGYTRDALKALPTIQAYNAYYGRFKKTYHVQLQLESVALKGKSIPWVAALVEAMFMAELKNQLLTAGHDLDVLQAPVRVDVATGAERYVLLNGQEQQAREDDMMMVDGEGIISSVLHGPDQRTRIKAGTQNALFAIYAPAGIDKEAVRQHLLDIEANVRVIAPAAEAESLNVYVAD
jgi:DNA/RNA-binding domain of Phe-tRNA-synthetase-like protein